MSEARRLTAILAADVAGYSRLVGADEEGTVARLQSIRAGIVDPSIAANHGRIVNTAGDSVLAEFASVVDAVRAALAIQSKVAQNNAPEPPDQRIEFRIGIHLGDVMVQADGDLLGDGVNIAARLGTQVGPGGICLSEDAVRQVEGKVEAHFTYAGSRALKNIAQPVRAYTALVGIDRRNKSIDRGAARSPWRRRSPLRLAIILGAIILFFVASRASNWYFGKDSDAVAPRPLEGLLQRHGPPRFSIVILPFINLSGDPSQDYFADGITENLTTDVARIRGMTVIARNTSFSYKGKDIDARTVGKELNVRYVLEGSVQRDGDRVRVNAQLIDTRSGTHIWADRFDEARGDLFRLEDEIVARLANSLGNEVNSVESENAVEMRSRNPDAIDLSLRALAAVNQSQLGSNREKVAEARALYDQALKLNPNDYFALIGSAWLDIEDLAYRHAGRELIAHGEALVDRALVLAPEQAEPHVAKSMLAMLSRQPDVAATEAARAIELDANNPNGYGALAWSQTLSGHDQEALANIDKAITLSPRDPTLGFWLYLRGSALVNLKRYDEAAAAEQAAIDAHFSGWPAYLTMAVAYALKGDISKAQAAIAMVRQADPQISLKTVRTTFEFPSFYWDGLRKAGLPEG
jgi:adenylate cyclase